MKKIIKFFEDVYYRSFSSLGVPQEVGSPQKETMFQSIFVVITLRLTLTFLTLFVLNYAILDVKELFFKHWVIPILTGYLFAPLVALVFPKKIMKVPSHKIKDFLKGAYLPIPLTLVWLLPKFIR